MTKRAIVDEGPREDDMAKKGSWRSRMVLIAEAILTVLTSAPVVWAQSPDIYVSLSTGQVQRRSADGTLVDVLVDASIGQASSLAFDAAGILYVPHWYAQTPFTVGITPGNTVERFDASDTPIMGDFGSGYNCNPSSLAFDAAGNVYVGQADCTGNILKFDAAGNFLAAFAVPITRRGSDHIALAADGCTMLYSSRDQNIYRYDVCTNTTLTPFNVQPLPGPTLYHIVILPDGGVLAADATVIVRLDAGGNLVQTYNVVGESGYLWGGVDFVGDGTFWATNGYNSNVYRFDLQSGTVLAGFNTDTGNNSAAGIAVKR